MLVAEQRKFKAKPRNIAANRVKGVMAVRQDYCAANFGSVTVVGEGTFLRIGGDNLIGFHLGDGNLEISLCIYNESDGLLVEIVKNEWVSGDPLPWDIEADWQVVTLRERARHITLSIDARTVPLEVSGEFYRFGQRVSIKKDGIRVSGRLTLGLSELALVGTMLEIEPTEPGFRLGVASGNPNMVIISWHDRRERLWKAKEAWRKIERARTEGIL